MRSGHDWDANPVPQVTRLKRILDSTRALSVQTQPSSLQRSRRFLISLALLFCASCGMNSDPDAGHHLPDAAVARQAVEESLRAWQNSPQFERTTTTIRPVMFVEQQQPPGQRLRRFEILGESPGYEGYRRFVVRLSLEEPEDSIVVSYYVFGRGPIWVYRAEDFEMIMHMDKSMMSAPPSSSGTQLPPIQ